MFKLDRINWIIHGLLKRIGSDAIKRWVWNREFASGKWNYLTDGRKNTDKICQTIDKYLRNGDILELGCGFGLIPLLLSTPFHSYVGVDISDVAFKSSEKLFRNSPPSMGSVNFIAYDVEKFIPAQKFDVILLDEVLNYFKTPLIPIIVDRYTKFLNIGGVIIVKMHDREKYQGVIETLEKAFNIVETVDTSDKSAIRVLRAARQV